MGLGTRQQNKQPFVAGEKRLLAVLVAGSQEPVAGIEAEFKRVENHPTHEARYYELKVIGQRSEVIENKTKDNLPTTYDLLPTTSIQLNHGDPTDDEARLAAIAEDLLTTEDTENAEDFLSPVPIPETLVPVFQVPSPKSLVPEGGEA